ncbi:DNA-binding HxlR family transcriptional regulator [Actinoalloteichus hoggarensis]|uniref:Putative HTH-type transcriptional regulator YybR n=1 Tax=Actinoalloteichus hoggarensis TaxID=1470176 RepID=A0A221W7Y6_9PSEU|nr:helix-turn-helix domain-containing protein [Actinoalloteichus hoggarensis]ASO22005.1 putative HTH-type transcriptional regulator YybR [Actinoalloteichus hoggarensis]MBB5923914.1 DNA-binding HxlR family transcriptional regulator [Actinoalloteichus hoggarensis]
MSVTHTDVPAPGHSVPAAQTEGPVGSTGGAPLPWVGGLTVPVTRVDADVCPVGDVLRRIGEKWSVLVIVLLGDRPRRFNELHRAIDGISQRMLTRTLRMLAQDGLVHREVTPTVPPSVEYSLTPLGRTLLVPLSALADWAFQHGGEIAAARRLDVDGE